MRKTKQAKKETCMSCGAPIESGFFCARCVAGDGPAEVSTEGWQGSRFGAEQRALRERQIFREELMMWGKRLTFVLIFLIAGFGGWHFFGDRIQSAFRGAEAVVKPHDRTDGTQPPVQLDAKGNPVGTDHFAQKYDR